MELNSLKDRVDTKVLMNRPLTDWYVVLSQDCQVYSCESNYLAKRFDEINYKFCGVDEARDILTDNLYVLLTYKYFTERSEEIDERITKIVKGFTLNLKRVLKRVSFDENTDSKKINYLPDWCVAFRNGVYDFKDNKWLFRYDVCKLPLLNNTIYSYDTNYAIMWYFNYDFQDLGINVNETSLKDFVEIMKDLTKTNKNYCFELAYNIAHDSQDVFDFNRLQHLCEILGYICLQSFSQHFVMLIGSGQNGKNSLFDGCFTNRVRPMPSSLDLDTIENDTFVTGTLENTCHNIFLETSPKTYTSSNMIKALTGSMNQSINHKGVPVYSGLINCKYLFAGNDKDNIKFKDNTTGFRRRLNIFEIFYHWDPKKEFLKMGDYYDTSFSDDLRELRKDTFNTTVFIYLAIYGIMSATKNFTNNFKFTKNEWTDNYTDTDKELKVKIKNITVTDIIEYIYKDLQSNKNDVLGRSGQSLKTDPIVKFFECSDYDNFLRKAYSALQSTDLEVKMSMLDELENTIQYISIRALQVLSNNSSIPSVTFTKNLKKTLQIENIKYLYGNKPYVPCMFVNNKLVLRKR